MRFRFSGLYRETAKPVRGYVHALDADAAYQLLSNKGIVTEALEGDPEAAEPTQSQAASQAPSSGPRLSPSTRSAPTQSAPITRFTETLEDALESALDSSSSDVSFDALSQRYRGKTVRVIDRDKIRQRVAEVVDSTLSASEANRESGSAARERVADALTGLFNDPANISTVHRPTTTSAATNPNLADQIGRLTGVVEQAEGLIAAMQAALRNAGTGDNAAPRRQVNAYTMPAPSSNAEQNAVLREIFQSNLDLRRGMASQLNS